MDTHNEQDSPNDPAGNLTTMKNSKEDPTATSINTTAIIRPTVASLHEGMELFHDRSLDRRVGGVRHPCAVLKWNASAGPRYGGCSIVVKYKHGEETVSISSLYLTLKNKEAKKLQKS